MTLDAAATMGSNNNSHIIIISTAVVEVGFPTIASTPNNILVTRRRVSSSRAPVIRLCRHRLPNHHLFLGGVRSRGMDVEAGGLALGTSLNIVLLISLGVLHIMKIFPGDIVVS